MSTRYNNSTIVNTIYTVVKLTKPYTIDYYKITFNVITSLYMNTLYIATQLFLNFKVI